MSFHCVLDFLGVMCLDYFLDLSFSLTGVSISSILFSMLEILSFTSEVFVLLPKFSSPVLLWFVFSLVILFMF